MKKWTIIIIGASGDLARTRLIPTLYEIMKHEQEPSFVFIGAAKDTLSVEKLIKESIPHKDDLLEKFIQRSSYVTVDFTDPDSFTHLAQEVEKKDSEGNRLVYLSVSSSWYGTVTQLLTQYSIVKKDNPNHRVAYEKPFGWDAQSAKEIDTQIINYVTEQQIYRVDHYLSKALVSSLLLTRFSNIFFEPVWNAESIEQIQITLTETGSLEGRGDFYDQYGALKDVVQNHILQLMTYITMDRPESFDPGLLCRSKSSILQKITITDGLLGQYQGYTEVPGVQENSQRETYALLRAEVETPRWKGVPFFIKTGKALNHKSTEIHLVFKPQSKQIIHEEGTFEPNRVIIRISPDSALLLRLNTQKGRDPAILPISLEFCYRCTFGPEQPHSYENLFHEIMRGDKSACVSLDEIVAAWNSINQIESLNLPLLSYAQGTSGPEQAGEFSKKYQIQWDTGATRAVPN